MFLERRGPLWDRDLFGAGPFSEDSQEDFGTFAAGGGSTEEGAKMAFTFAAFCYLAALILVAICIFFVIYQIISIDELKTDYKNPVEVCNTLNPLVLPEYCIQMSVTALFVFSMQWLAVAWNVPLIVYHVHRYLHRGVMSKPGIYDPTAIMDSNQLSQINREGWIKMGFYLLSFFYYLYGMIYTLVTSSTT